MKMSLAARSKPAASKSVGRPAAAATGAAGAAGAAEAESGGGGEGADDRVDHAFGRVSETGEAFDPRRFFNELHAVGGVVELREQRDRRQQRNDGTDQGEHAHQAGGALFHVARPCVDVGFVDRAGGRQVEPRQCRRDGTFAQEVWGFSRASRTLGSPASFSALPAVTETFPDRLYTD